MIFQNWWFFVTWMRIVPLIWWESDELNQGIKKNENVFFLTTKKKLGEARGTFFSYIFFISSVKNNKFFYKSYLGRKSQPCCIKEPIANHMQFINVNCVCIFSGCGSCGDGVGHSYGVNLNFSLIYQNLIINKPFSYF